ncbi:endonuclease-reverse transcriptase [Plakobranchus ocellatus]|uniref:Endonuclease-reverse transcriptase n=1 Tax=Plakobranchus ocellatus TaxID=259542 RepID=A0AAV3YFV6_9GAST|nr:endonuclease-reverse transcriptase [Plakobranchus ocellatus]
MHLKRTSLGRKTKKTNYWLKNNIDILGITEHRWAQKGHFKTDCGGQIIYSGKEKAGQSGVAIFLSKTTSKSIIGYKPVNDRILTIRLFGHAKNITLIQVYAPTSAEEEIEEFYDILQKEVDNKDKRDILIISGDFNAKVGGKINREEDGIVGITGLGERNERGTILVDFAVAKEIAIKNTMFEKHPRRLFTWTSPDGKTKNQIDYIMIEKRWASAIQDVTTKPKADCDTDHELLIAILKIKLKIKKTTVKPIRYDVKDIGEDFTIETRNRFKTLLMDIEEKEPNEIANAAKNIINETAAKHLQKRSSKKQPWMSEDTLIKIKERKEAKAKFGIHAPVYRTIAKEVK